MARDLKVLTYLTFALKRRVVRWFRRRGGPREKAGRDAVTISGFIGLLLVIATMTGAQKLVGLADDRHGARTTT